MQANELFQLLENKAEAMFNAIDKCKDYENRWKSRDSIKLLKNKNLFYKCYDFDLNIVFRYYVEVEIIDEIRTAMKSYKSRYKNDKKSPVLQCIV